MIQQWHVPHTTDDMVNLHIFKSLIILRLCEKQSMPKYLVLYGDVDPLSIDELEV
jgi:hypothetical protein